MLEELKKHIYKKDILGFFLLIIYFTGIMTPMMLQVFVFDPYIFAPNYKIHKVVFRDQINNLQMLDVILNDDKFKKESSPKIGDFVNYKDGQLFVRSREEMLYLFDVYILDHSYQSDNFGVSSNAVTIFREGLIVEQIKDNHTIKKIKQNKHLFKSDMTDIQIGNFIWKSPSDKFHIIKDDKFYLKRHLFDPSQHGLLNIVDIKNALNNS